MPRAIRSVWCLAVRFKGTKQDPRRERAEARGNDDWAYVGDVDDEKWSWRYWYARLMSHYPEGRSSSKDPFFMAKDRVRWYTYACAQNDLRAVYLILGLDPDEEGTLHGLRVESYNRTKLFHHKGEGMAIAHGLWKSGAHSRYDRFDVVRDTLMVPQAILGVAEPQREFQQRLVGGQTSRGAGSSDEPLELPPPSREEERIIASPPTVNLPEGWEKVTVPSEGAQRTRSHYVGPNGKRLSSIPAIYTYLETANTPPPVQKDKAARKARAARNLA